MPKLTKNNTELIGLVAANKLITTALHIPFLTDENPVGILLVAKPGMGKSLLLTSFKSKNLILLNDITGFGFEKVLMEIQFAQRGYLVVPDLLRLMTRNRSWQAFLTLSNIVLEEGLEGIRRADANVRFTKPVHFGIITAMTTESFQKSQAYFDKIGFASRFGIFSYTYEQSDSTRIEHLVSEKTLLERTKTEINPPQPLREDSMVIVDPDTAKKVRRLGVLMSNGKHVAFRAISFVRRLVKAHAFSHGRSKVEMDDIIQVFALLPFFIPPLPIATDLEYLILSGVPDEELRKKYNGEEIYSAKERLISKGIHWNRIFDGDRLMNM